MIDKAEPAHGIEIPGHEGEGLLLPSLPLPEAPDSIVVHGVDSEMEAADPLDGDNSPFGKQAYSGRKRIGFVESGSLLIADLEARAANGAGVRLCMEPPVGRVMVLPVAFGTEPEPLHRG